MSSLKKRTFGEAFGQNTYETIRYDGIIEEDYFKNGGVGHGVYNDTSSTLLYCKILFPIKSEREKSNRNNQ